MKNFPHQINNLSKLLLALRIAKTDFADQDRPLTDTDFGEAILRNGIRGYRNRNLTFDEYLVQQRTLKPQDRSYETTPRDLRFFFQLLGFIVSYPDHRIQITPQANDLLNEDSENRRFLIWKNAFNQLSIEGRDGEISHPYRILLKLVNTFPGIETSKLMLALEAENDSDEEFERLTNLIPLSIERIIEETGTTRSMADNAVKILPGIAVQLGDIERVNNQSYPVGQILVTEDDITTQRGPSISTREIPEYRQVNADQIARDPILNSVISASIDMAEAIRKRQSRLVQHQEIVRSLALVNVSSGLNLYEGKFDCLATTDGDKALLYEVKTILETTSDQEKQTVKGVGQLKYYKYSIVQHQMNYQNISEFIVYSQRPSQEFIDFCQSENIKVVWINEGQSFTVYNAHTQVDENFNPANFL